MGSFALLRLRSPARNDKGGPLFYRMPSVEARKRPEPDQPPAFTPAKTVKETTDFATHKLKINKVDYKSNRHLANTANAALTNCACRDIKMPLQIAADVEYFKKSSVDAWGVYVVTVTVGTGKYSQAIVLNPEKDWEDLAQVTKKIYKRGFWSTDDPHHVIYHEVGHMTYSRQSPEAFSQPGRPDKHNPEMANAFLTGIDTIRGKVSKRGEADYREFVGVVFAMKITGKSIPKPVTAMYNFLKGPPVKRAKKR